LCLHGSDTRLKAAGTLICAINPLDNKRYVLLAQEGPRTDANSCKWSGFGGGRDGTETLLQTAIRETFEESRGLIKIELDDTSPIQKEVILCKDYKNQFALFIISMPFDAKLAEKFHFSITPQDFSFQEKIKIQWVLFSNLMTLISKQTEEDSTEVSKLELEYKEAKLPIAPKFMQTLVLMHKKAPLLLKLAAESHISLPSGAINCVNFLQLPLQ
jgi:8-oxo-dGTP pyrophosphatase MutT (NUDIX family)